MAIDYTKFSDSDLKAIASNNISALSTEALRIIAGQDAPKPAPSTERTWGEAIKDVPASLLTGAGSLLQAPGQLAKLVPGLKGVGEALEAPGEAVKQFGTDLKSTGLKAREALRSQAISDAEKDGILSEFATAITSTLKDPALITSFITEQVPLLLGPLGAARLTTKLGMGAVEGAAAGAAREAAAAKLGQKATTAAIGTGTAMQAADVSGNTYDTALKRALEMGMSQQEAEDAALNAARISAGGAAAVSLGATVGLGKLGGTAIERRLAGLPGKGRIQSGVGEATSETLEEAGGQVFQNVGLKTVDPSQSLTQGVGSAAAMGALGGGFFGSMLGKRPEADLAPGQLPGESLYDAAARINRDIKTVDDLARQTETDQARTQSGLMTNTQLVDMYREQGYGAVKQYQQQLLDQAADPSLPREQKTAAREAAQQIQELFKQVDQEEVSRRAKADVSNIITDKDVTINLGIPRKDPLYDQLVNKNLGRPEDAEAVIQALESALTRKGLRQTQYERFNTALSAVNEYLATIPGSGFYARPSVQQPSGASPVVASVPSADAAPTGGGAPQPSGVVSPEPDAAQPVSRKAEPTTPIMEDDIAPQKPAEEFVAPAGTYKLGQTLDLNGRKLRVVGVAHTGKEITVAQADKKGPVGIEGRLTIPVEEAAAPPAKTPSASPPAAPPAAPALLVTPAVSYLPKDLAGAKPRYSYGEKAFQLQFNSDIDKALYIAAQKTPSKRDADYRAWLGTQGFTPEQITQEGQRVREAIKRVAAKADPATGPINLPEQVKKPAVKRSLAPELEKKLEPIYQDLERRAKAPKQAQPKVEPAKEAPKKDTQRDLLLQRRAELVKQLDGILKKILAKYNLTGVTLNLEEGMADEGSYSGQIIKIALNLENPVRVLRHESIHALKDMGFFSDAQWKTLVKKAQDEWVDKYLKGREHNATQSRYDAYVELLTKEGKNPTEVQEAIIEEAIADAFGDFDVNGAPPGLMAAIHRRMKALFKAIKEAFGQAGIDTAEEIFGKIEKGSLKPAIPVGKKESGQFNAWKATEADVDKAEAYEEKNGIKPYLSEGRLDLPTKYSIKSNVDKYGQEPILGIPLNKDGTVTVYYHTVKPNVFKLNTSKTIPADGRDRIYLTNESSGAKVYNKRGNFDQDIDGSVVLLNINPSLLQIDQEYDNGRKDFFVPLTQGNFFNKKMQAAAIQAPRTKAIVEEFSYKDHQERIAKAIEEYNGLTGKEKQARLKKARDVLKREHNIGTLMTENGKLEKTRMGDYGLLWDGKPIDSMGLGLAAAQQISEKLSTCPNSAICEGLCLGETSGGNFLYGGAAREDVGDIEKTAFRAGPRMVQYLKTEALIVNPEEFSIVLQSEIDTLKKWDNSPTYKKKNKETGKLETIDKDVYQSAVRLNVTSDFKPEMWSSLIDANPEVMFYDYTKLVGNTPIAPNHHLTYSSTGFGQTIGGEEVFFKTKSGRYDHNWPQVRNRLNAGYNVAMAFSSKSALPKTLVDEETGTTYNILDGDDYDARFLDEMSPLKQEGLGVIVGLRNKASTLKEKTATKETDGFFADYDPKRDGDSITVPDQTEFGAPAYKAPGKTIPISKKSLRSESPQFKFWFGQSKIVDKDGKPKVMYHGTARDITEFKPKQANAIFLTDDPKFAEGFADASSDWLNRNAKKLLTPEQFKEMQQEIAQVDDIDEKDRLRKEFVLNKLNTGENIMPLYVKAEYPFDYENKDHVDALYKGLVAELGEDFAGRKERYESGDWSAIEDETVQMVIKQLGFDSFYINEGGRKNLGVFNPEQIKSATGNIGTYDVNNPDIRYSLRSPIGLYSELENKVEAVSSKAAPAGQWKTMINAMTQKGVKPEEIEWSGVNDWLDLQAGKVNKDDLLDYLKNNGVQVEETVLGNQFNFSAMSEVQLREEYRRIRGREAEDSYGDPMTAEEMVYELEGAIAEDVAATKYGQYTLPGGENYREVLLTLPEKNPSISTDGWTATLIREKSPVSGKPEFEVKDKDGKFVAKTYTASDSKSAINQAANGFYETTKNKVNYKSKHWDQANILAHIRVNDRTDADGNKVLFVEEIQSDWGQEGKKKGFRGNEKKVHWDDPEYVAARKRATDLRNEFNRNSGNPARQAEIRPLLYEATLAESAFVGRNNRIGQMLPAAPFVGKTEGWLNLALKRIMIMAAEGGYDKVAFVNGEQSADRYDLSKKINELYHWKDGDKFGVSAYDFDDRAVIDQETYSADQLEDYVGKEIAQKIVNREGDVAKDQEDGVLVLSGLDLKVGGEGMVAFYDKIVPTTLKKLLPKVGGGKMDTVSFGKDETFDDYLARRKLEMRDGKLFMQGTAIEMSLPGVKRQYDESRSEEAKLSGEQPGFDVTPAMREKVETTGLPKFSLRSAPTTPEFKRWFDDSKVVDEDGEPALMYHYTTADITEFKPSDIGTHVGTIDQAESRTKAHGTEGGNIMPLYVSIKNPLRLNDSPTWADPAYYIERSGIDEYLPDELVEEARALKDVYKANQKAEGFKHDGSADRENKKAAMAFNEKVKKELERQGYDGIVYSNTHDGTTLANKMRGDDSYIAFNPEQIKSATGNIGTYSPETGDIRRSLRSTLPASAINAMDKIAPPRYEPGYAERIMNAITGDTFTSIRQKLVNRYEALAVLDRRVAKTLKQMGGATQLASSRAETAALMSDLGAGVLEAAMGVHDRVGGAPIFRNGVTTVSNYGGTVKGLLEIFKPIAAMKDADAFRMYQTWAAVKRGKRLTVEGREDLIDAADIRAIDSLTRTNKDMIKMFEQVQKDWTAYNNALVKYQVDTGVISPAMAKEWTKHGDYFPFYRLMEGEDIAGPKVFSSIGNVSIGKKLKGGEDPLGDFFENIVRNSQAAIQAGMKNVAAQAATNQALIINEVTRLNRKPQSHESVYRVYENGKEVYYRASDPLFIEAIKALNMADLPFMGLLSKPAAMLRNLVTKDPAFMLANMMRDSLSAWATTGIKMTPIIDTLNNFGKAIAGKSPELDALYAAGVLGGYDYARGTKESADVFEKTLRRRSGQMTAFEVGTKPFTSLWEALEKGTQASDAATRMEVYKKTLAATGNELEALSAALEVMNFNRKGNSAIVRVLTAAVPFLNARIQGLDILFRTAIMPLGGTTSDEAVQRMKTFWVRGMTIMALSSMYWLLTHDDDEYKKQEQETRDNNWLIPTLGVKIPIPFEVGVLFKVIPERLMQLSFGTDTTTDFTDSMKRQFLSTFAFNLIPQTVLPLYEVKTNYSFFTDRPIIGKGLENVVDKYQVGPSTSRVAQMIGEAVGYSPMKTDYLIKGYFGTIGSYASDLFDMMYDMGADSPKASKRFAQMPIIKRFAVDPDARGTVTAFYKLKDQVDQAVRTANLLERSNNFEEGTSYTVENLRLLASDSYVKDVEKSLKDYREMKQQIMSMPLSADAKRDLLLNVSRMESLTTADVQSIKKFAQ